LEDNAQVAQIEDGTSTWHTMTNHCRRVMVSAAKKLRLPDEPRGPAEMLCCTQHDMSDYAPVRALASDRAWAAPWRRTGAHAGYGRDGGKAAASAAGEV